MLQVQEQILERLGTMDEPTLNELDAELGNEPHRGLVLDPFGDDAGAKRRSALDHRAQGDAGQASAPC